MFIIRPFTQTNTLTLTQSININFRHALIALSTIYSCQTKSLNCNFSPKITRSFVFALHYRFWEMRPCVGIFDVIMRISWVTKMKLLHFKWFFFHSRCVSSRWQFNRWRINTIEREWKRRIKCQTLNNSANLSRWRMKMATKNNDALNTIELLNLMIEQKQRHFFRCCFRFVCSFAVIYLVLLLYVNRRSLAIVNCFNL